MNLWQSRMRALARLGVLVIHLFFLNGRALATPALEVTVCPPVASAKAPPGHYQSTGVQLDYARLVPEPDPTRGYDASYVHQVGTTPALLEQLYADAERGERRAAWLVCQFEWGAQHGARESAQTLYELRCQTLYSCTMRFDRAPFSTDTASGRRILNLTIDSFEREAERLGVAQTFMKHALGLIIGLQALKLLKAKPTATVAGAQPALRRFPTFEAFKRAFGAAGPAKESHHIVEQTPGNLARFGAEALHNTDNIIAIDAKIHRKISGYYSSQQHVAGGQIVRQWLSTQSFDMQREFGLKTLRDFGAIP